MSHGNSINSGRIRSSINSRHSSSISIWNSTSSNSTDKLHNNSHDHNSKHNTERNHRS